MANPPQQIRILIIAKNIPKFKKDAQFLTRRGWPTDVVPGIKQAVEYVVKYRPMFVMVSFSLPNSNITKLPNLLSQTFNANCIAFGEGTDPKTTKRLNVCRLKHIFYGALSGPSIHMRIKKILIEMEKEKHQQARAANQAAAPAPAMPAAAPARRNNPQDPGTVMPMGQQEVAPAPAPEPNFNNAQQGYEGHQDPNQPNRPPHGEEGGDNYWKDGNAPKFGGDASGYEGHGQQPGQAAPPGMDPGSYQPPDAGGEMFDDGFAGGDGSAEDGMGLGGETFDDNFAGEMAGGDFAPAQAGGPQQPGGFNPQDAAAAAGQQGGFYNPQENGGPAPGEAGGAGSYNPQDNMGLGGDGFGGDDGGGQQPGAFNPQDAAAGQQAGAFNPQDAAAGQQPGAFNPQDAAAQGMSGDFNPQDAAAGQQAGAFNPQDAAAGQQAGAFNPQDAAAGQQAGAFNPQDAAAQGMNGDFAPADGANQANGGLPGHDGADPQTGQFDPFNEDQNPAMAGAMPTDPNANAAGAGLPEYQETAPQSAGPNSFEGMPDDVGATGTANPEENGQMGAAASPVNPNDVSDFDANPATAQPVAETGGFGDKAPDQQAPPPGFDGMPIEKENLKAPPPSIGGQRINNQRLDEMAKAFDKGLEEACKDPQDNPVRIGDIGEIGVVSVRSQTARGYLLFGKPAEGKLDGSFWDDVRSSIQEALKDDMLEFELAESFEAEVDKVSFVSWAAAAADFISVKQHEDFEIAMAFFSMENVPKIREAKDAENMTVVDVASIVPDIAAEFRGYINFKKNDKMILYIKKGRSISGIQKSRLINKSVEDIYIPSEEADTFRLQMAQSALNMRIRHYFSYLEQMRAAQAQAAA